MIPRPKHNVKLVRIDHDLAGGAYVECIMQDGSVEPDSIYLDSRADARRRAEVLARLYGCEWEEN